MKRNLRSFFKCSISYVGTFTYLRDFNYIDLSIRILTRELNRVTPRTDSTHFSQYEDVFTNSLISTLSIPIKPSVYNKTRFTGVLGVDIPEHLFQQVTLNAKVSNKL